jgi:SET and MYND domain-containing protein
MLLLWRAPAAGPQQASLSVEQLQVSLASDYSSHTHAWLQQLYDGSEESTLAAMNLQHPLLQQQQQPQPQPQQHTSSSNGEQSASVHSSNGTGSSSSSNGDGSHQQQLPHTIHNGHSQNGCGGSKQQQQQQQQQSVPAVTDAVLQRLMDVVRYNAYGDRHDDLAAAALAEQQPVALLGLWPEFSLLNHSCVPNAINWVLPGVAKAMVVRAARHIAPGTCSRN